MNDGDILNTIYGELAQVSLEYKAGKISEEEFSVKRAELERTLRAMEGTATPYPSNRQDYPAKGDPSFKYDPKKLAKIQPYARGTKGVRRSEAKEERSFTKVRKLKGHGPRHADAVHNTDTVPAMLTPREAVLNRNAAELAGRGNIEALNAQGNKLAKKGVDLASGGKPMKKQKLAEGGQVQGGPAKLKNPYQSDANQPGYLGPPDQMPGFGGVRPPPPGGMDALLAGRPNFTATQWYNPAQGAWQARRPQGPDAGGPQPMPLPQPVPSMGGGFYPPDQGPFKGLRAQAGTPEVQPIGTPATGQAYGPPIQLSAPDILSKLQAAGKEQGLSSAQINGLMNAFKGAGQAFSGGGGAGTYYGSEGAAMGSAMSQLGYQGGISDIGYPPFVAPGADYHGDKGGWQGRYDPNYFIPNYG